MESEAKKCFHPETTTDKTLEKNLSFMGNSVLRTSSVSFFKESFASYDKIFFLGGRLGTRL